MDWPAWVQDVSVFATAMVAVILAVWRYAKAEGENDRKANKQDPQVVAASFVDSRLMRELIDALREAAEENSRIANRIVRSQAEVREAMIELNENVRLLIDSNSNLLRFLRREINEDR